MTTPGSDFDAAKAVADQLKGMEKDRQQRILRRVAESLSLDLAGTGTTDRRAGEKDAGSGGATPQHGNLHSNQREQRSVDIKSFVDSKKPKSDVQFATV